jgi:hypothetical protein
MAPRCNCKEMTINFISESTLNSADPQRIETNRSVDDTHLFSLF